MAATRVPSRLTTFRLLESRATALFSFETMLIPGYLQTVPYMQAVMRGCMIETRKRSTAAWRPHPAADRRFAGGALDDRHCV